MHSLYGSLTPKCYVKHCGQDPILQEMWFLWQEEQEMILPWYNPGLRWLTVFGTYIIIFTNFIPISLLVTIDLTKVIQSRFIEYDVHM